jgi:hypothetical protein
MKLHRTEQRTADQQNIEADNFEGLFPFFDIRYSLFDIRFFEVSVRSTWSASG